MYDMLKPSVFWKIWQRRAPNFISGEGPRMALIRLWLRPQTPSLALSRYKFLAASLYNRCFRVI